MKPEDLVEEAKQEALHQQLQITQHNCSVFQYYKNNKSFNKNGSFISKSGAGDNVISKTSNNRYNSGAHKPHKSAFDRYVPYSKRSSKDKHIIRKNVQGLEKVSTVAAVKNTIRQFVGSISISNKKSLNLPSGVHKLDSCPCDKNHQFLYLCDGFKKLPQASRVKIVKRLNACKSCLLRQTGPCKFNNRHICAR